MTTNHIDPLEAANEVQPQSMHYFGQVLLSAWYCALVKGQGKVPFDPAQHDKKFTAIDLTLAPTANSKATYTIERQYIAEFKEWAGTVLPSLHALNSSPMAANQKWAHVEMVKTGTYQKNGETKDLTSPKFLAIYQTEAECEVAAAAFFGRTEQEEQAFDHTAPATPGDLHPAANGNTPGNAAIEAFVNVLYGQAQGDLARLEALIKGAGMAWDSPEVQAAVAKKTAAVSF
jgi:hypothetical protein